MTHRRECECVECLTEYGDWFEAKRLLMDEPADDEYEDFAAYVESDPEPYYAELGEGVANA